MDYDKFTTYYHRFFTKYSILGMIMANRKYRLEEGNKIDKMIYVSD